MIITFKLLMLGEIATRGTRISDGVAPPCPPTSAIPWSPRTKMRGGKSFSDFKNLSNKLSLIFLMIFPISCNLGLTSPLVGPSKCPM